MQNNVDKTLSPHRGMRVFADNEGRYTAIEGSGKRLWIRDQVTLQADVVNLLRHEGALPKKRIIMGLGAALAAIDTALAALLNAQRVECYKARSQRGRMDEHWCIVDKSLVPSNVSRFHASEILAAMQAHASKHNGALR